MLKSIVVALDGSSSSANGRKLALEFARKTGAALVGLGVLDVPWITAPRATPIGGGSYQEHRNEHLLKEGRETLRQRVADFHAECDAAGVGCSAIGAEGDPVEQIDAESDRHDLIVLGRETNFHGEQDLDIGETVERLLSDTPRPLVIAPEGEKSAGDPNVVVVAFDGSMTSSRAMHMFVLLGLADDCKLHVVSIDDDQRKAAQMAERGAALFRSHGIAAESNGVVGHGSASDTILGAVATVEAGRLVMGAFGHQGRLRRVLMGSTTKRILRETNVPVFVHH